MLLVGNFGDGTIHAFNLSACPAGGTCPTPGGVNLVGGAPVVIDGLWSLDFGKGNAMTGNTNQLFFTGGPNAEANGVFGMITVQ
jgi:hypothetical protein